MKLTWYNVFAFTWINKLPMGLIAKIQKSTTNKSKLLFILIFLTIGAWVLQTRVIASHCSSTDYDCQISEIQKEIDALTPAHEQNKKELDSTNKQVTSINARISGIDNDLKLLEEDIKRREKELGYATEVFNSKADSHYRLLRLYDPLIPFLSSNDASEAFIQINIRSRTIDDNRKTMEKYVDEILSLNKDKESLKSNQENLASLKSKMAGRAEFLEGEVEKVESYLTTLSSKQQELAALKAAGFQTSIGDTPPTLEPCSGPPGSSNFCDPGFRPAFAAFSFGAPHRTGMSQYGAYGRSKSGQSAEQILAAYYQGGELNKGYPVPATINVSGYGAISFEENYLMGIHEVPESWGNNGGFEALKAQAVAARSYALAVTNNGAGTICPTESCQVYKPTLKSGKWAEAVRATRGWVITKGGKPASTYYASTSGGYTVSQWGWSGIKDAAGDWPGTAYEKISGSPWFYKGWYKSRGGATCGKSHPWLTSKEMADILNARHVLDGKGGDAGRISPVDTGCWGGNPYSMDELASIGGYTSVSSVSVVYGNDGSTQSVTFSTNKGSVNISGGALKEAFNLRAPGYIGIKSSLFNIEKI